MGDPFVVKLTGGTLKLVGLWSDVLAYAVAVCVEACSSGPHFAPTRIAIVQVELLVDSATLYFERRVGGQNNIPESVFRIGHTVPRDLIDAALTPEVWQFPIRWAVQRLAAEVPALGVARRSEE